MKILYSTLIATMLITVFSVQAEDTSATLTITGNATNSIAGCSVTMSPTTFNLESIPENAMPWQGGNTIPKNAINLSISGTSECYALALGNRLAYRFIGTPDAVEGNVLANTDTSSSAATGVGIGLYNMHGEFLDIKKTINTTDLPRMTLQTVSLNGQRATKGSVSGVLTIQLERL